jgi:ADP-ribose pyrophosphatase
VAKAERFEWLDQKIIYQESRSRDDVAEARWALTSETIKDRETDEVFQRSLLRHPGVAAIVPITDNGDALLIEQFRYSIKRRLWEIPAGTLHGEWRDNCMMPLESAEQAAARELCEETGFQAGRLVFLQSFYAMPGTSDGLVHLFLGFDLAVKEAAKDVGEVVTRVEAFPLARARSMIATGEICDAKTIIGIYAAISYLEQSR